MGFYFFQLRYLLLNPILKIKLQYCGNTAYGLLRVLYLKQENFFSRFMSKHVKQGKILKQLCLSQLEKEKGFYVLQV